MKRYYVIFTGTVQGVGFRWSMQMIAQQLGYTGWIRNQYNGNVEMEIQGQDIDFNKIVYKLQNGNWSFIKIDDYSCKEIPVVENEKSFKVVG